MKTIIYIKLSILILGLAIYFINENSNHYNEMVLDSKLEVFNKNLFDQLEKSEYIVIGEKHYTNRVQNIEAKIIENLSHLNPIVGWEFLDRAKQSDINSDISSLSSKDFLNKYLKHADSYIPVIETIQAHKLKLAGTNLSREEKHKLLYHCHFLGSDNYKERFTSTMSNHVDSADIDRYFKMQAITDCSMADAMVRQEGSKRILITGSFHMEYNDGVIEQIKKRTFSSVTSVLIIDASDYKESDLLDSLKDTKYGPHADYIILVNEPKRFFTYSYLEVVDQFIQSWF